MTSSGGVVVHRDAELLAAVAAARLVTGLVDAISARGSAHLVLTGGGVGIATLAALAASPARDAVDWRRLHVWWGDERFLPAGHPDRNETQARAALLDRVPLDRGATCTRCRPRTAEFGAGRGRRGGAATPSELQAACEPENRGRRPAVRRADARGRAGRARGLAVPGAARALYETER